MFVMTFANIAAHMIETTYLSQRLPLIVQEAALLLSSTSRSSLSQNHHATKNKKLSVLFNFRSRRKTQVRSLQTPEQRQSCLESVRQIVHRDRCHKVQHPSKLFPQSMAPDLILTVKFASHYGNWKMAATSSTT